MLDNRAKGKTGNQKLFGNGKHVDGLIRII